MLFVQIENLADRREHFDYSSDVSSLVDATILVDRLALVMRQKLPQHLAVFIERSLKKVGDNLLEGDIVGTITEGGYSIQWSLDPRRMKERRPPKRHSKGRFR